MYENIAAEMFTYTYNPPVKPSTTASSTERCVDIEKKSPRSQVVSITSSMESDEFEMWTPSTKEYMVMVTMAISSLMVALDATILVSVLPTLAVELHGTAAQAFWTGTSYLLSHAVTQPFIAALSDIFGRRELLVPSIALFAAGSIICATAHDFLEMLVGRVVQGIGGAGIITLSQMVYADIVPLRQRPKYFTFVLIAWALGSVSGPLLGGVFVQKATWRWCFYLNLPICGVALPMAIYFVRLHTIKSSLTSKLLRVDWIGGLLFISGLTSLLVAISWGGVQFAWGSWHTIVPLAAGTVILMLSLGWERFCATEPFLNKSLFRQLSTVCSYCCAMLQGLILYMALYYMSFYFSAVRFKSPIDAGVSLFPATVFMLPGSAIVSALISRLGKFRWAIWIGWLVSTAGTGLMILLDEKTKTVVWAVAFSVFGLGMGMVLSSVNFSVQAIVEPEDAGRAAAMYAFMRSLGMALGVAIGGTIFQNLMAHRLAELGLSPEIAQHAESYIEVMESMLSDSVVRSHALSAYVYGFRGVFEAMTGFCGAGLLISTMIKHCSMDKILQSRYRMGSTA